jgi:hypothetical protein
MCPVCPNRQAKIELTRRIWVVNVQCRLANLITAAIVGVFLPDISAYAAGTASAAGVPGEHDQHLCMLADHFRVRFVMVRGCGEHTKPTAVTDVTSAEGTGTEVPGHRAAADRLSGIE